MIRTQIQLTDEQARDLKARASEKGISMAELIRQSLAATLHSSPQADKASRKKRAIDIAGRFRSGKSDLSAAHDRYAAESYGK